MLTEVIKTPQSEEFLALDALLTDEAREVRERVRNFVNYDLLPVINEHWENATFPSELLPRIAELGVVGTTIKGYGCPGHSFLTSGVASMEMGAGDGSMNTFMGVQSGLAMGAIHAHASDEQRERWLPAMARLEKIGAFALTEPAHGSDSRWLETSASKVDGGYMLNGNKRWIGNGSFADLVIIWARIDETDELRGFVLEKDPVEGYPEGYRPTVITGKVGKRAVLQPDIVISDLFIPDSNVLPGVTKFRDINQLFDPTRMTTAWEAVGHARTCYELAREYVGRRDQFGRKLASFQLVQNKLAGMLAEITSSWLLCYRVSTLLDEGNASSTMASLAKMHTVRMARDVAREARDMLGGNGLLLENHIARHFTDLEVIATYEGTDSILSLLVGRKITGISAFN